MSNGNSHEKVEKNVGLMAVLIAVAVSFGGLAEIVPLMFQAEAIKPLEGVKPYPALQLAGRALEYIEGQSGKMLDPTCVRGLLDNVPRLLEICDRYSQVVPQPDLH